MIICDFELSNNSKHFEYMRQLGLYLFHILVSKQFFHYLDKI